MSICKRLVLLWYAFFLILKLPAQDLPSEKRTDDSELNQQESLFHSDSVLELTIGGPVSKLMHDRSDKMKSYPMELTYLNRDQKKITLSVQMKTRGHFRRLMGNCMFPPLLIEFSNSDSLSHSIFREQRKTKLVMPCRGEEWVVREWLVYKIYNLFTPLGFRARLVRLTLNPTDTRKTYQPFLAMILEEEEQLASRNHLVSVTRNLKPEDVKQEEFLTMAVFQYLIGNTDWSVQYLQNIKLLATDSLSKPITVPYDFDLSGMVDAPYAKPAEELRLSSVKERLYRGNCVRDFTKFDPVLQEFRLHKSDIYRLFSDCPYLDTRYQKNIIKFLDDFFETINDPNKWQPAFSEPCDPNGRGNVIIRGLRGN